MEYFTSRSQHLQATFGCKVYKPALNGSMICPNRGGTLGRHAHGANLQLLHMPKGTDLAAD